MTDARYLISTSPARPDQPFASIDAMADALVAACRDWRHLEARAAVLSRTAGAARRCIALHDMAAGEFIAYAFGAAMAPLRAAIRRAGMRADDGRLPEAGGPASPVVSAFFALIEQDRHRREGDGVLSSVIVQAHAMPGVGLVCQIDRMPMRLFNDAHLALGPGVERSILSPEGETAFNRLFSIGRAVVAQHLPGKVFALILGNAAVETASDAFRAARAA